MLCGVLCSLEIGVMVSRFSGGSRVGPGWGGCQGKVEGVYTWVECRWPIPSQDSVVTPIESQLFVNLHFSQMMVDVKLFLWFHSKTITISWPWAKKKYIYNDYPLFQRSQTALLQIVPL